MEYEIKFNITDHSLTELELLIQLENVIKDSKRYLIDKVRKVTLQNPYFFSGDSVEYSVFNYEQKRILKIKNHNGLPPLI